MFNFISIITIAAIGVDRVDFFGGAGPFVLTPFLVLSPVIFFVLLLEFLHDTRVLRKISLPFFTISCLLLITLFVSATFSNDQEMSFKRLALVVYEIFFTVLALTTWNRRLLLKGAYLGFFIFLVFNCVLIVNWIAITTGLLGYIDFGPALDLAATGIGSILPRLSGYTKDPNQSVFISSVYFYIIYRFGSDSLFSKICLVLLTFCIILSLSKSGISAFCLMITVIALIDRKNRDFKKIGRLIFMPLIILATLVFFVNLYSFGGINIDISQAANIIFARDEGSSGATHLQLLQRGWDVATSSVKNILVGNGVFASENVLSDIFPNDKYANFHSLYISFLAESGLISFVLMIIILFFPVLTRTKHVALVFLNAIFGIFYQIYLSPAFWLTIGLIWGAFRDYEDVKNVITKNVIAHHSQSRS